MSRVTTRHREVGSLLILALLVLLGLTSTRAVAADPPAPANAKVSYDKQIRLIFQANCQGCHQPSKAGGGYVMTSVDRLLGGGDSKERALIVGKPEESHLVELITPENGQAEMPKDKPPLTKVEIALIRAAGFEKAHPTLPLPPLAKNTTATTRRSTPAPP